MQFLVIAYDSTDENAFERRLSAREKHLVLNSELKSRGKILYAGAMLNAANKMIGSTIVCDFDSREELDEWLKIEPYVTGKVWENIEIHPFKVAAAYL